MTAGTTRVGPTARRADVLAVLSLAVDVALAQPLEQGLRTALVADRLADLLGLPAPQRRRTSDVALLRHVGCTAYDERIVALLGDEMAFRVGAATVDWGRRTEAMSYLLGHLWRGRSVSPAGRHGVAGRVSGVAVALPRAASVFAEAARAVCEVGDLLAADLGLDRPGRDALGALYDRWAAHGEAIPVEARVVQVAETVVVFAAAGDSAQVARMLDRRGGGSLDPGLARLAADHVGELLAELDQPHVWDRVVDAAGGPADRLTGSALTALTQAVGRFADAKSPFTTGHSAHVARLAGQAARYVGLDEQLLQQAGHLHDLGRVGVPAPVWTRPGPLSRADREQVRLHTYLTERLVGAAPALADVALLAASHHERLDGSGYHRGLAGAALSLESRVLAAADAAAALSEKRAHRDASDPRGVARALRGEARAGCLDGAAVEAVLEATGQPTRRPTRPAGLTARELDVLALLATGLSVPQIARVLVVSPRTVGHHVESIYAKTGVSTRAAAALWAAQRGLLGRQK